MREAHTHLPTRSNPNLCVRCAAPWNAIQHQPSLAAATLIKVTEVQDSVVYEPDLFCDHPNGFGPMGCPCGAVSDDETNQQAASISSQEETVSEQNNLEAEVPANFHTWWVAMADREAPTIQRKAEEYGTNSLVEMGKIWARAQGREITDLEAIEIGCFLYAYGKIQRVADALLKGKSPNVDSWHDLSIYSLMVMYSREKGNWP